MKDKKVIFMGTPSFAVKILESLIENTNVIGVVTQPDKEVGRKHELKCCPVKQLAISHNIKVFQPIKIKDQYKDILDLNPDIIVTCAYGQILPKEFIYYPPFNTINVHASLLPKLRGGAPIQRAILNGEKETGITIMETDPGMDSGNILKEESIPILDDTYDSLSYKLSNLGAKLLIETLPLVFNKSIKSIKQDENLVTKGFIITKDDEHISFNNIADNIINHIRALSSVPGAYALLNDERIKIYNAHKTLNKSFIPGRIKNVSKEGIEVETKDYNILLDDVSFPGKKRMMVKELINGLDKNKICDRILR